MRIASFVIASALAVGCKGSKDDAPAAPPAPTHKVKTRLSATEPPLAVRQERDKLLVLDDALQRVQKQLADAVAANDQAAVARLRDEEHADELAYQKQLEHVKLFEFMWQKQLKEQEEADRQGSSAATDAGTTR